MAETAVTLSNGQTIQVKRLGLFELDSEIDKSHLIEPYTVTVMFANGTIYEQPFDVSIVRDKPDKPFEECEEKTAEYYQWQEYMRWQQGFVYYQKQIDAMSAYFADIEAYILDNCLSADDAKQLETWQDFDAVYQAAIPDLPDQAYLEEIAQTIYQAKWGEVSAFEAYHNLEGSEGGYAWIPQQVMALMIKLGETEERFLNRSKREIGLMMVADLLPGIMEALQADKQYKEMRKQSGAETG